MIVTGWNMSRFLIASLLTSLLCARPALQMPIVSAPPTTTAGAAWETPSTTEESAAAPTAKPVHGVQASGEEGPYFQGDIRLLPNDDPYELYGNNYRSQMVFDAMGGGSGSGEINPYPSRLWPDGRVPYRFATHLNLLYRHEFMRAMAEWSAATCLTFVSIGDVNITEEDYIVFTDTEGCSSFVGRIGGPQEVSIDHTCFDKGHAMHEIGHALGLWHEHSRWDRDTYIRIVRENIEDNAYYNFGTIVEEKWSHIPRLEYDLLSIMHYGPHSFSKNGQQTIEVVTNLGIPDCAINQMGQRKVLSRKDKIKTSRMYTCPNETNPRESCVVNYTNTTTEPPTTPTTPPPPNDRLFTHDHIKLNTDTTIHQSMQCTDARCKMDRCRFNHFSLTLSCRPGMEFAIRHYEQKKNMKIKNGDIVVFQSLHKSSRWLECNGHNICSISDCPSNNGLNASANVSECADQRFMLVSERNALKDGSPFSLKHETNDTYIYCTIKWCDLLPECEEGEIESDSDSRDEVLCHTRTTFYVEKLYT